MAKTLPEYADWLDERSLIWPKAPAIVPARATPFVRPLPGIRAVTWSIYGTLLRISDGELLHDHPLELRMQVAMDKTVREFNMWNSMTRRPGEPWRQMYEQYATLVEHGRMAGSGRKGDVTEVDSRAVWRTIVERLQMKDYRYDLSIYGDEDELAEKIAYFFHSSLQGTEASPGAARTLRAAHEAGLTQTLLGNAQCFTLVQLLRALETQSTLPPPGELFAFDCLSLSYLDGVRSPSPSLYQNCVSRLQNAGFAPCEVLHVGCRLSDDLAFAKALGMRTALYAADKTALRATKEEIADPMFRPDRLLTDLAQLRDLLQIA
jgi:FMN phosphatase YigB (HAD superfamily)